LPERADEPTPKSPAPAAGPAPNPPTPADDPSGGKPLASPVARDLAASHSVDLSSLRGSGPGGRIVKRDVEDAIAGAAAVPAGAQTADAAVADGPRRGKAADGEGMSRMRRTIAARMEKSKREIPHFYLRSAVDLSELMRMYEAIRADKLMSGLTVTHLLLRAVALTLPKHQRLNALWVDDSIQLVEDVNIGIAVALEEGLLVPVVKRAQTLTLRELVAQARALTERARANKPHADDLVGATISVSNIGMLDVDELTPIINAPQAAILGVGAVRERPVVRAGEIVVGRTATVTLACDHRVVNGIEAGGFLEELKRVLESPLALVVESE
jgi:pyruvate dehydrogenase E2 component (dihydrolipoamide acetyltransferase)